MILLDSNIFIYLVKPKARALRLWAKDREFAASFVSFVEVLGYPRIESAELLQRRKLLDAASLLDLTRDVAEQAADLRQQRRMGAAASIIAATALVEGLALVTHNTHDYAWTGGLELIDPLTPP